MFKIVEHILSSALAASGSVSSIGYPAGTTKGSFLFGTAHKIRAGNTSLSAPGDFTIALSDTTFAITLGSSESTIPSGTKLLIQLDAGGDQDTERFASFRGSDVDRVELGEVIFLDLGNPLTADTDNMIKAATSTELPNATTTTYTPDTDGTSPCDGVGPVVTVNGVKYWKQDVPRNITAAATHGSSVVAMTIVVTGLDEYGEDVVESLSIAATGTSQSAPGVKAIKYIRSIAITSAGNATTNTLNVGFGDVLGLPVGLPKSGQVLKELQDGAAPTAGTVVAAVQSLATATTGDVRGTYDPNAACDGSKSFGLIVALKDPTWKGVAQYGG